MDNDSKLSQMLNQLRDQLQDQVWFQQLKTKWEEIDPQSRLYLQLTGVVTVALLVVGLIVNSIWSVHQLKQELADRTELVAMINSASDELRQLRESGGVPTQLTGSGTGNSTEDNAPWPPYIDTLATTSGVDRANLKLGEEKPSGSNSISKEVQFDINLNKVTIKQLTRFAVEVENGTRPIKVRNLAIDTAADLSGYLNAVLTVSAFQFKN